jgi:hypothetical protein
MWQQGLKVMSDSSIAENELLLHQSEVQMEDSEISTWNLISGTKYPNLRKVALYVILFFSSTYLCESAFSVMTIIR